jgi:riboflavin transporter
MSNQQKRTRQIVLIALFIALSTVGAFIKIPSPTGTVAFDSLPAFLAALLLGGIPGAIVGFLGHMASAASTGFPMTVPIHLFVGVLMAVIMLVVSFVAKKINPLVAMAVGIILNGVGAPAAFILLPKFGTAFFVNMVLPLTVGSIINIVVAGLVYYPLRKVSTVKRLLGTAEDK